MNNMRTLRLALFALGTSLAAAPAVYAPAAEAAPIVIGHRGASGYLPEHTLAAYELAAQMGADYIEPDLQFTSDGHLVAVHDSTLSRTTNVEQVFGPRNGSYAVSNYTLAEIKQLTVTPVGTASNSYPGFTPTSADPLKVPTFEEVLDMVSAYNAANGTNLGVYPEAKQADPAMEDAILATLAAKGYDSAADNVYIQSFSADTIQSLNDKQNNQGTDMDLVLLGYAATSGGESVLRTSNGTIFSLDDVALFADGVGLSLSSAISEEWIAAAHAAGLLVHGWTFNRSNPDSAAAQYEQYLAMGMDGMFSNYPDLAVASRDAYLAQVPEPASLALVGAGLLGLAAVRRRARG